MPDWCAIDFGTSNSAIAVPAAGGARLVPLDDGQPTMPTAVFYAVEGLEPHEQARSLFGRAALAAYVEGVEGRLMRSMKSILGSTLAEQATDIGAGRSVRYLDVVSGFLRRLKTLAEAAREDGAPSEGSHGDDPHRRLTRAVIGRPVFFVDGDPERDALAQAALERAAREVGFTEVRFQYEPIAAALDYESTAREEQLVLVADIGGGTSDFSLVRVGPALRGRTDRRDDILGNHGVHVAGTDFDRHLELMCILPACGYRALGPTGREVPSKVYFDLATWHLINGCYAPARVAELARMKGFYADPRQHARLMKVLGERLGHALVGRAEQAKIEVADQGRARLDLALIDAPATAELTEGQAVAAIDHDLERIVDAARETLRLAGVAPARLDALYFTGGSTGLAPLSRRIAACFPAARAVHGDRLASVAQGLGMHAARVFAGGADRG